MAAATLKKILMLVVLSSGMAEVTLDEEIGGGKQGERMQETQQMMMRVDRWKRWKRRRRRTTK